MTKEEILKMEAGPEIDAVFAELVMGWEIRKKPFRDEKTPAWFARDKDGYWYWRCWKGNLPAFSTNISHAMEGVDVNIEALEHFELYYNKCRRIWETATKADFGGPIDAIEAVKKELSITRALILWAMEKETTNVREISTE